jgi:uncharacterized protein (TIGR02246 family)
MNADEKAIRDLVTTWMDASKSGDTKTVLSLMTEDAVFMVPGHEPFGRQAFETASAGNASSNIEGTSEILELQVLGEWAYMRCRLHVKVTPSDGNVIERAGHTLTIFRKEPDGRWLLARDANLLTAKS